MEVVNNSIVSRRFKAKSPQGGPKDLEERALVNMFLFHVLPKESLLQKREKKAWIEGQRKSDQFLSPSALVLSIAISQPASQPASQHFHHRHSRNQKSHPHLTPMQLTKPRQQRPNFSTNHDTPHDPKMIPNKRTPNLQNLAQRRQREESQWVNRRRRNHLGLCSHLRRQRQAGRKWRELAARGFGTVMAAGATEGLT